MAPPFALATITPSGNRVVEHVVQAMMRDVPGGSAHFTRIPVVGDTGSVEGYDMARMLDAARLLSHARPDAICWNGTKGGTLGFDVDRRLCAGIQAETGIPACTSAMAILDLLSSVKARRIALITPYDDAYQHKCIAAFAAKGVETVCERHSGLTDNFSYGEVAQSSIAAMTQAALAETRPDAVVYFCTNFHGAALAPVIEAETGIPVFDSAAVGVWAAMKVAGRDVSILRHWGMAFGI